MNRTVRKILFSPLENKIHFFAAPCNILYIFQEGRSALHYAAYSGSDGIVKILLTKKADATLTAGVRAIGYDNILFPGIHLCKKTSCAVKGHVVSTSLVDLQRGSGGSGHPLLPPPLPSSSKPVLVLLV